MRILRILLAATLLLLPGSRAVAAGSGGTSPFQFLFLDADARAVGLGGAYSALAVDANALLYNPAGLARIERHHATFMHNQFLEGISQQYIGLAMRQGLGLNLNVLNSGDVQRTLISNPTGSGLGSATLQDLSIGAGYGYAITEHLSLGGGVKLIREAIDDVSATAYATDLGLMYKVPQLSDVTLAMTVQNLGPDVTFIQASEPLPATVRFGAAHIRTLMGRKMTFAADIAKTRAEKTIFAIGLESMITYRMAGRLGFNSRNDAGPGVTAGIGWRVNDLAFDYAFVPFGELGTAHRLSVGLRWGKGGAARAAKPKQEEIANTPEARFAAAEDFLSLEMVDDAMVQVLMAGEMIGEGDPLKAQYYERLGQVHWVKKEYAQAKAAWVECLRRALSKRVSAHYVARAYLGIGRVLAIEGDKSRAIRFLQKTLAVGPDKATAKAAKRALKDLGASN
jgi:hypothetical protein